MDDRAGNICQSIPGTNCSKGSADKLHFMKKSISVGAGMKKLRLKTVDDIIYFAGEDRENLLIKVRGRGWFISSGPTDMPGLTIDRLDGWLKEDSHSFHRVKVQHFHMDTKRARNAIRSSKA